MTPKQHSLRHGSRLITVTAPGITSRLYRSPQTTNQSERSECVDTSQSHKLLRTHMQTAERRRFTNVRAQDFQWHKSIFKNVHSMIHKFSRTGHPVTNICRTLTCSPWISARWAFSASSSRLLSASSFWMNSTSLETQEGGQIVNVLSRCVLMQEGEIHSQCVCVCVCVCVWRGLPLTQLWWWGSRGYFRILLWLSSLWPSCSQWTQTYLHLTHTHTHTHTHAHTHKFACLRTFCRVLMPALPSVCGLAVFSLYRSAWRVCFIS